MIIMTLEQFKTKLINSREQINFSDTIALIDSHYSFTPTAFRNGDISNKPNENNGSCKVFSFALDQELTKEETLACFGAFYFEDVLGNPQGTDHQNIRNFIKYGFDGLLFENKAIVLK